MRLPGFWLLCDDGILRPVFRGEMATVNGNSVPAEFLVDTGADRTVLCASVLQRLGLPHVPANKQLVGAGGAVDTVIVDTAIHLQRDDGGAAIFRCQFAAFREPDALDTSVLGRDISNLLVLIVDRPRHLICLLGAGHQYAIAPTQ